MHEAGLAASVADALRRRGLERDDTRLRLLVHGGHDDAAAFDDAFRLHLAMALPGFDQERLVIRHTPVMAVCVGCGQPFTTRSPETPCPACGAPGLRLPTPESVEIEAVPRRRRPARAPR